MNKKKFSSLFRCVFQMTGIFTVATVLFFSVMSCADDDITQESGNDNDKGIRVSFNVLDVQQDVITRGLISEIPSDDLVSQKLEASSNAGLDVCLIESTVEGVNPTQPNPATRANVLTAIDADFTTLGYRSDDPNFTTGKNSKWFYKELTKKDGGLYSPVYWRYRYPFARFYSIYPKAGGANNKLILSDEDHNGVPYIDFEVERDVTKQYDLMTACSGYIQYKTPLTAPQVNLAFRHALTAVKFAIGQNLSWGKTIDRVELRNVQYKGRYILSNQANTPGTWVSLDNVRTNIILSGLSVSTSDNPNTVIMGDNNDNYVFYMLPQTLTGNNVKAYFHFTDNTEIEVTLTGNWKAGTTKTYKLSQNNSTWDYHLEVTNPASIAYTRNQSYYYYINSYRKAPDGTQQAVKWRVTGYEESTDEGKTWINKGMTKPDWLTALSQESGNGGTSAESGFATVRTDIIDLLPSYNNVLKNSTSKGNAGNYYNLANQTNGGTTIQNTANCYIISAPGYYQIPLVYGNAIKNGTNNINAYRTSNSGTYILQNFKNHANQNITSPYINVQNSTNPARQASIVWTDVSGIVDGLSVVNNGANSFVRFRVPADKIRNGNAVIAVKNSSGVVMWSWHLWFDQSNALSTVEVTNHQKVKYNFTQRNLGAVFLKRDESKYKLARKVRVKVEQLIGNAQKQKAVLTITQDPGSTRMEMSTYYQWGRKDALPGVYSYYDGIEYGIKNGTYTIVKEPKTIGVTIQNPSTMYAIYGYSLDHYSSTYINTWSANNKVTSQNDNAVVKTVYDPSPVGFKVPASNAFTGFSTTGKDTNNSNEVNVVSALDDGLYFRTSLGGTASIYFPYTGSIGNNGGNFILSYRQGSYWTAGPLPFTSYYSGCYSLDIYGSSSLYFSGSVRSMGFAVRPVRD